MRERVLEIMAPALAGEGALLVDATLGLGGHTEAFLEAFPSLRVLGIDRDLEAGAHALQRLQRFEDRVTFFHGRYDRMGEALDLHAPGIAPRGILLDLGVSSLHLDKPERGFSYSLNAPLDMRMNPEDDLTAELVLAEYSLDELADIFRNLGDEKLAGRYARAIIAHREKSPLRTTGELVDLLQEATPYALKDRGHPAKRVFQALRMQVNSELDSLAMVLPAALDRIAVGGRIVVMSYHSGEDRLVKKVLRKATASTAPLGLPEELPEHRSEFRELTRGAEMATPEERAQNPRSASVRTRAVERTRKASQ
jgi:16S rRNA (cytosine1402-N4)-methyltransferase